MTCQAYTSNTKPKIKFSGSLPSSGACFTNMQQLFAAFIEGLQGYIDGDYSTFVVSDTEPAPEDRDKVWLKVDPTTCFPIGFFAFNNGIWTAIGATVFSGVDSSVTAGTITVNATSPQVSEQRTGQTFFIKANNANPGAVTVTIKNGAGVTLYNAVPLLKYGTQPLGGLEFLSGMMLLLHWNGTNMQILNPRGGAGVGQGGASNLSFEQDANEDGLPDDWSVFVGGSAYAGNGGSAADAETSPTGGTAALDATESVHGRRSMKFTCANGGVTAGGGFVQTAGYIECDAGKPLEFTFFAKVSAADIKCRCQILWYSDNQNLAADYISKTDAWINETNNAVNIWYRYCAFAVAPSGAKYYRIRLYAGYAGNPTIGTVWFDDVRLGPVTWPRSILFDTPGAGSVTLPATVKQYKRTCVGGGGGAGGSDNTGADKPGGGGGGGETAISLATPASTGINKYPFVVGTGGNGGAAAVNGSAGTATTFNGTDVIANPGLGGGNGQLYGSSGNGGGAGGSGGTGTLLLAGENGGGIGGAGSGTDPGTGGSSSCGGGGNPKLNAPGTDGCLHGGGGGSSRCDNAGGASAGGKGAKGKIVIEYWAP